MNREGAPGKSPEEMYIQQKVRVLLMLRKMGSNVSAWGLSRSRGPAALKEGRGGCRHFLERTVGLWINLSAASSGTPNSEPTRLL